IARLHAIWHSAVYGFFKPKILIDYDNGHKYFLSMCSKIGVHHYQDSQDQATTSNLKVHAMKCFGADGVNAIFNQSPSTAPSRSIFATFAHLGQKVVSFSHCAHTSDELR
ncbi:hypothetical protein L208DRAFT_1269165, partial [Tricholoma matsutake]